MNYPSEWHLQDKINAATNGLAKSFEVHETNRHVDRLEHSLREARTEIASLRSELQELRQSVAILQDATIQLQEGVS